MAQSRFESQCSWQRESHCAGNFFIILRRYFEEHVVRGVSKKQDAREQIVECGLMGRSAPWQFAWLEPRRVAKFRSHAILYQYGSSTNLGARRRGLIDEAQQTHPSLDCALW